MFEYALRYRAVPLQTDNERKNEPQKSKHHENVTYLEGLV